MEERKAEAEERLSLANVNDNYACGGSLVDRKITTPVGTPSTVGGGSISMLNEGDEGDGFESPATRTPGDAKSSHYPAASARYSPTQVTNANPDPTQTTITSVSRQTVTLQ